MVVSPSDSYKRCSLTFEFWRRVSARPSILLALTIDIDNVGSIICRCVVVAFVMFPSWLCFEMGQSNDFYESPFIKVAR